MKLPDLCINLNRIAGMVRSANISPYERWQGLSVQDKVRLLAQNNMDTQIARWEWRSIPSKEKLKIKNILLKDFSHSLRTEENFLKYLNSPTERMDYLQERPDYFYW